MSTSPIIVKYDSTWPQLFAALAEALTPSLGRLAHQIHHVGSTAIPGMAAKPILDIDIELAPDITVVEATAALEPLGYEYEGDLGIPGRYAYRRVSCAVPFSIQGRDWPPHHLYVCPFGSRELDRHLRFRDRLRNSDEYRQEYMEIKQQAIERAAGIRQVYVDEKPRLGTDFFRKVLGE